MKCQSCGKKDATVHLTDLLNGEETHLCDKCAESKGAIMPSLSISSVLSNLIESHETDEDAALHEAICPMCGISYPDMRRQGKAGCARCYEVFAGGLVSFVERIQGSSEHRGKAPRRLDENSAKKMDEFVQLKQKLKVAVMEEDYELAAELRDEIKELETNKDGA